MKMLSMSTILTTFIMNGQSASWNYEERGQNHTHWELLFAECGYSRQSPINLPLSTHSSCAEPLTLEWTSEPSHYAIRNNGHSLQATPFVIDHNGGSDLSGLEVLHHTNDTNIRLKNKFYGQYESFVNREYCFDSLHFHWGRHNEEGSEHTVNGKAYPLEVHLVHYSCDYNVAGEALKEFASGEAKQKYDDENVLAVIGVFFEIGAPNPVLEKILDDMIVDGIYENVAQEIPHYLELYYTEFDVKELLPESWEMMSYLGSLTTPPCYETVRWHVMKEAMTVSQAQMDKFRMLLEGTDVTKTQAPNYRPPQPRYGRKVWQCQEDVDEDEIKVYEDDESISAVADGKNAGNESWKNIAIIFAVLLAVTLLASIAMLIYLCRIQTSENEKKASHGKVSFDHRQDDDDQEAMHTETI